MKPTAATTTVNKEPHPVLVRPVFLQRLFFFACSPRAGFSRPVELSLVHPAWHETISCWGTTELIWRRVWIEGNGNKGAAAAKKKQQQSAAPAATSSPFGGLMPRGGGGAAAAAAVAVAAAGSSSGPNSKFPETASNLFLHAARFDEPYVLRAMLDLGFDPCRARVHVDKHGNLPPKRNSSSNNSSTSGGALPTVRTAGAMELHSVGTIALHRAIDHNLHEVFFLLSNDPTYSKSMPSSAVASVGGLLQAHTAASRGSVEIMKAILRDGSKNKNAAVVRDKMGETSLHKAAAAGSSALVKLLVTGDAGGETGDVVDIIDGFERCDVNCQRYDQDAALHIACARGDANCVEMLLALNADANLAGSSRNRPLHYIANFVGPSSFSSRGGDNKSRESAAAAHFRAVNRIVSALAQAGASIDQQNESGRTPLHEAVERSNSVAVDALLTYCPMLTMQDRVGNTPAHLAATNPELLKTLFTYDPEAAPLRGRGATKPYQRGGHPLQPRMRLDMMMMMQREDSEEARLDAAFEREFNNDTTEDGDDVTAAATTVGGAASPTLVSSPGRAAVRPSFHNNCDNSPTSFSSPTSVSFSSSSPPASPTPGSSPNRSTSFVTLKNKNNQSTMALAASLGAVKSVELILENNITPTTEDGAAGAHHDEILGAMIRRGGLDVNAQNFAGESCLHLAAAAGVLASVEHLLRWGANPRLQTKEGDSVLHVCADNVAIVRKLIIRADGVPTTMLNEHKQSALILHAARGHAAAVSELLRLRARTSFQDSNGDNCLHVAVRAGHREVVRHISTVKADFDELKHARNAQWLTPLAISGREAFVFDASVAKRDIYKILTGEEVTGSTVTPTGKRAALIKGIDY